MTSRRTSLSAISVALALAGCASTGDFAEQGQKANVAIEQTQNNMILLNAVRASHRRPMHFTTISTVKTPLGTGVPTFTLGFPGLGADRDGRKFYAPSATYKPDTPNFDVTVWDGQAFMKGVTTPVSPTTFVYYLEQGWPMQLLVALLVREIRVLDKDGHVQKHYLNYPEDRKKYKAFQDAALELGNCEFVFDKKKGFAEIGPMLSVHAASDPVAIAKIKEQGLTLAPRIKKEKKDGKDVETVIGYQVIKETESAIVNLVDRTTPKGTCKPFGGDATSFMMTSLESAQRAVQHLAALARDVLQGKTPAADAPPPDTHVVAFTLRSPEAALYHLGELTRVQFTGAYEVVGGERKTFTPSVDLGFPEKKGEMQYLFVVHSDRDKPVPEKPKPAAIAKYDDVTYWIPSDPAVAGRSMRMLTLVEQLINLHKDAKDMPSTTTIRITQ